MATPNETRNMTKKFLEDASVITKFIDITEYDEEVHGASLGIHCNASNSYNVRCSTADATVSLRLLKGLAYPYRITEVLTSYTDAGVTGTIISDVGVIYIIVKS